MSDPEQPRLYEGALSTAEENNLPALALDPGDRDIRAINDTFEQIFGWSSSELEGVDYREVVPPDDRGTVRSLLSELSSGGFPSTETVRLLDAGGQARETKWVGVPNLRGEKGKVVAVICRPTSWREGDVPEGLDAFDEEAAEEWVARTFDADDEREGSHSSSLWD